MHVRVCRDCGEEYRPEIAVCADCGGRSRTATRTTRRREPPRAEVEPTGPPPPDLSGHRAVFSTAQATRARAPGRSPARGRPRLRPERDPRPDDRRAVLDLRPARARRGRGVVRSGCSPPFSAPKATPERLHAVESAFRAARGYERCPACERRPSPGSPRVPGVRPGPRRGECSRRGGSKVDGNRGGSRISRRTFRACRRVRIGPYQVLGPLGSGAAVTFTASPRGRADPGRRRYR